jgi:hypothetical protein
MAFHRHPIRGSGQSTLIMPQNITVPTVNLNVAYDWDNMLKTYHNANSGTERQRNAVATLMYHIAAARGVNTDIHVAITTHFGYDKSIQCLSRKFYTDAEWEAIIRQQLDAGLPMYLNGNYPTNTPSPNGYHASVIDGYDNTGKFHINWGWNGSYDGWYSLNNLKPEATQAMIDGEQITINIMPDKGSTGSNEWALNSFAANKSSVSQNELFTVSFRPMSAGFFIGGQFGAVLVDNSGNIAAVIGTRNASARNPRTGWSLSNDPIEISGFIPNTVAAGQYKLRIVTKHEGGEWKIVARSDISENVPNAIPITVTAGEANGGGYGMSLERFEASKTAVSQLEQFAVSYTLKNITQEAFPGGQAGVALSLDGVPTSINFTVQ